MTDTTTAADFFVPGRTYITSSQRVFRCIVLDPHPVTSETRAIGWYATSPTGWPSAEALDQDDFTHMGWTEITNHSTTGEPT